MTYLENSYCQDRFTQILLGISVADILLPKNSFHGLCSESCLLRQYQNKKMCSLSNSRPKTMSNLFLMSSGPKTLICCSGQVGQSGKYSSNWLIFHQQYMLQLCFTTCTTGPSTQANYSSMSQTRPYHRE